MPAEICTLCTHSVADHTAQGGCRRRINPHAVDDYDDCPCERHPDDIGNDVNVIELTAVKTWAKARGSGFF